MTPPDGGPRPRPWFTQFRKWWDKHGTGEADDEEYAEKGWRAGMLRAAEICRTLEPNVMRLGGGYYEADKLTCERRGKELAAAIEEEASK